MIKTLLSAILLLSVCTSSSAQTDTTTKYVNYRGKETTKDSAYGYIKTYMQDNAWHGKTYLIEKNVFKSEGIYTDATSLKPAGTLNNYTDKGLLDYVSTYEDGEHMESTYYYPDGKKKSWISYRNKEKSEQKGWDESGKEIKDFVVEREARFEGGADGWRKFLEKNLDANVAANAGAPAGQYQVKVQFIVSKEGHVSNVKAVSTPAKCKPCGREVVRVIANGPEWIPAVQNNVPVIYQAIQYVTFEVAEEVKKGKRG